MRKILMITGLFIVSGSFAQNSWTEQWSIPISDDCAWDVDQAGNTYLVHQQTISKLDTLGRQLLTQSSKALGTVTKIDASNWLKIAVFSEDQQLVCYLDNALGIQPGCIELADLGITLAQQFATSAQTDRIWVYDQLNSELQLITIRTSQRQIVQNLKSLAETGNSLQLTEFGNMLYFLDDKGLVVTFDNFGTFTGSEELQTTWVQPFNNGLLLARNNTIVFHDEHSENDLPFFDLPDQTTTIMHFHLSNKRLYISTTDRLYCFRYN